MDPRRAGQLWRIRGALAVSIKANWPAELRAHAQSIRAAVLWTTRAPLAEVNREIDAAREASTAPLRVPESAFRPELLRPQARTGQAS